jgi:lipid A 3-O-deacylase
MNGTLAVLFLAAGLTDMSLNHCGVHGCLARIDEQARASVSGGEVLFEGEHIGEEVYLRYEFGRHYGPFQPVTGASITSHRDAWWGLGAAYTKPFAQDRAYVQLSLMPGLYSRGNGPDLGFAVEFRSAIELGYQTPEGMRLGVSYDHRSNADVKQVNPGLETVQFRISIPLD